MHKHAFVDGARIANALVKIFLKSALHHARRILELFEFEFRLKVFNERETTKYTIVRATHIERITIVETFQMQVTRVK